MTDILITHSYFLRFDPKQWTARNAYPPLAALYAASVLRDAEMHVSFFDTMFRESPMEIEVTIKKLRPKVLIVCDDGFNYLTKMCLTNMRQAALNIAEVAKKYACKVVVSSSDSTDHSDLYLQKGVDYIVVGEAENTLLELCKRLLNRESGNAEIPGLRWMENGKLNQSAARSNMRDLDTIPFPAWDLVDMEAYRKAWMGKYNYFSLNMTTTRGCPFKCNWCAKPIYGNRYNSRSPENVVKELQQIKGKYSFDKIWFCDDIFGLKPGWVQQFSNLIKEAGLKIKFKIQSRADLLLETDTIEALCKAGAEEVWIGAESGSQKILNAMDKGITVEQIYKSTILMHQNGIKPCFFLQFGYPGETADDIRATMEMVFDLKPHDIGISVSYPLPGTKFYERVKEEMGGKQNWAHSDDLHAMFRSTFAPAFYRHLQRYVHFEFRKRKALDEYNSGTGISMSGVLKLVYRNAMAYWHGMKMKRYGFHPI